MSKEIEASKTGTSRSMFTGKMGFILAAAASAVGLGNLWRFPYLAAKYGGGAFLITYIVLVVTFGFSLMIAEVALGRRTRLSSIGAFKSFGKKFTFIGILGALVPFIITPYYCVIGGWVLKYAGAYLIDGKDAIGTASKDYFFATILNNDLSYAWMVVFMLLVILIVAFGVNKGIETSNKVLMPLLILMGIGIWIYSMTIDGAGAGLKYYLVPDFSKFSISMVVAAMGQMFFSLSLAMGIMVTYGSYFSKEENLERSVRNIEIFDTGIAILAGLIIIPASFAVLGSGEAVAENAGPGLMFVVLPGVFQQMPGGSALGFCFFLLVLFAALTSAISLFETLVSIVQDLGGKSRRFAIAVCSVFIIVVGCFVNMGYNVGLGWDPMHAIFGTEYQANQILDFFDFLSNTVMMPLVALLTCIFVGWIIKPQTIIDEVEQNGVKFKAKGLFVVMIKYIAPILVVAILLGYVFNTFGLFGVHL